MNRLKEKGYNPLAYRFMCLNTSYRKVLVFSYEILENAQNAYEKLKNRINKLNTTEQIEQDKWNQYDNQFKECMEDDLNTPNAITLIYELLKSDLNDTTKKSLIESWDNVLSLDLTKQEQITKELDIEHIKQKIEERKRAKEQKEYQKADEIRNYLESLGVKIIDTREGTSFEII